MESTAACAPVWVLMSMLPMPMAAACYTKNNILVQSAQAMLAQANQIPQGVLQLLG